MASIQIVKQSLPEPLKIILKNIVFRPRNRPFKSYLKKLSFEGEEFDIWISDEVGRTFYDSKTKDPDGAVNYEMQFIKDNMIETGDVVFDCGAHQGITSILFSKWAGQKGKVIAFEALPNNCDIFEKNIEQNGIRNVRLERKAVGAERGRVNIKDTSNSYALPFGEGMEVDLTCLDEYEHLNPKFIKIDVEGFEFEVLQGAEKILSKRPKLDIEIHTALLARYGTSVEDIFKLIYPENYKLWIQQGSELEQPEEYDLKTQITDRSHLFCIPRH